MTAKEYLQEKYPQMRGDKWNSHSVINDDWVAEMMEEYLKLSINKAYESLVNNGFSSDKISIKNAIENILPNCFGMKCDHDGTFPGDFCDKCGQFIYVEI